MLEPRSAEPGRPVPSGSAPTTERSIGELIGDLVGESTTLLKQEVALAKAEIRQDVKTAAAGAGAAAAGGAVAYAGLIVLLIGVALLLATIIDVEWLAFVIVGLLAAGIGYVLVNRGKTRLQEMDPTPERTIATLKEDKEWLKNEIRS